MLILPRVSYDAAGGGGGPTTPTLTYRTPVVAPGAATVSDTSFTPASGDIVIVVGSFIDDTNGDLEGADITIDDTGAVLTWTNEVATPDGTDYSHGIRVAVAVGTGAAITPRITVPATCYRVHIQTIVVSGGNTSDPIGATGSLLDDDADGTATITLNATPDATSYVVAALVSTMQFGTPTVVPSSGYTQRWETTITGWGTFFGMDKTGHTSTSVTFDDLIEDASGAGGLEGVVLAFEVKGAP
jgi:hypothetical protein